MICENHGVEDCEDEACKVYKMSEAPCESCMFEPIKEGQTCYQCRREGFRFYKKVSFTYGKG